MVPRALKINTNGKIAVLRAGALGDFLVTLPALQAIRNTWPAAEIVLLGNPWQQEFLVSGRTPVDRVVVVPVYKKIREEEGQAEDPAAIEAFFSAMQQEAFDLVINFQGDGVFSTPFIKKLGATTSVGLVAPGSEQPDRYIPYYYYQSEVLRFVEVVGQAGANVFGVMEPQVNILEQDEKEIEPVLAQLEGKTFIVINPCAKDIRRMWPLENYPALADQLRSENLEVVFTGSPADRMAVAAIMDAMRSPALNTCGMLTLGGLAALISKSTLFIGPDTGPLHLARAVNSPTIGMYWAPNLINWGPLTRGIHFPLISWELRCPFCGIIPNDPYPFQPQKECSHNISFVRDIKAEQILHTVQTILSNRGRAYSMAVAS